MQNQRAPIHPSSIVVVLLLAGLTMLFIAISFAFIYARVTKGVGAVEVPVVFLLNVGVLLLASYQLEQAKLMLYQSGVGPAMQKLLLVFVLTLLFLILQLFGWSQLFGRELFASTNPGFGYLYALSGLHLLHVIGGLPFLVLFLLRLNTLRLGSTAETRAPVDADHRRLRLIGRYWHFVDLLWIYLVAFLLVNRMF